MKYVLVSGGVVSGLGKGITSSSLGVLLQASGLHVTHVKIDPYLNIDAGVLSPYEHGEVFVLDDGGEVDLDLGNYERFSNVKLTKDHNLTTGKVYQQVIARERKGDYLGKTVQVVPHVTNAVQEWIERVAQIPVTKEHVVPDVCIIELGGTVGDIESMVFLEAFRQFRYRLGAEHFCHLHVSLVPTVGAGDGEQKSKPTQHGIQELRKAGLQPDIILCRSSKPLEPATQAKISLFCMVPATHVVSVHDVSNLYKVPLLMITQRVPSLVLNVLKLEQAPPTKLPLWENLSDRVENPKAQVTIGIVGKYTGLTDSYLSITKAIFHAAIELGVKPKLEWIESTRLEPGSKQEQYEEAWDVLRKVDGILIPGGFGDRGIEGKILAVTYARTHQVPYLGICLGMQLAVIEYARNVLNVPEATSAEFDPESKHAAIVFMPEISTEEMGGTMRLGSRASRLAPNTLAHELYGQEMIMARHRHRYEVNPDYVSRLEGAGLNFSGKDYEKGERMECAELPADKHPFFWGCQFHPEYTSSPFAASPPFRGFLSASIRAQKEHTDSSSSNGNPAKRVKSSD
jgi:CTP synthase